ncbi:MAG: MFS transporter [Pseudonocardia sediminis]
MPADLTSARAKTLALVLLAATQFVVVIDASIVTVALPSIGAALQMSPDGLSWVVNAYVLAFGGFLLLGGRLADALGRRRMFVAGIGLFTLASLLGGLAPNPAWLIAARAAQGLGAAIASPAALSIITTTFDAGRERNRAFAVWGAVAGAGGAVGVLLGGVLTEYLGWSWVLFVNVPIGALILWQAPRRLLASRSSAEDRVVDVPGAVTVTGGLALLVYALVDAPEVGWTSAATLLRVAGALLLLAAFVVIERRTRRPLVPFSIFSLPTLRGANVVGLFVGMSLISMFFLISLYLQQVLGLDPLTAGLAYLPLSVAIVAAAALASPLVARWGFKPVLLLALAFVAAGLAWFSRVSPDGSFVADVLGPSLLAGVGLGLSFAPLTIAAVTGTTASQAGLASGLINAGQQIGGALGLAVIVSVANAATTRATAAGIAPAEAATRGFGDAFLLGAGLALVAFVLAAALVSSRDSREHARLTRTGPVAPVL